MTPRHLFIATLLGFLQAGIPLIQAATLRSGFIETRLAANLAQPSAMEIAPDGRIFFLESKNGAVRIIKNGALLPAPFVTMAVDGFNERGLLGIAFDPSFASNQYVYFYYTATAPEVATSRNRVVRYTASGDVAVPGSKTVILELDNLGSAGNHNGGAIHFGPDGKLYVAVGENATPSKSQSLTTRLGKMLRINKDGTIPADNPTTFQALSGTTTGDNRAIWAVGLRNPFTFAFQPETGRMFINDVGQGMAEEINDGIAGRNYGWTSGLTADGAVNCTTYTCPLYTYLHGNGTDRGFAITGGAFYNPATAQFPSSYTSDYLFADYVNGWINIRDSATGAVTNFATGIPGPVDLKVGSDGSLYYLSYGVTNQGTVSSTGAIFKVQYTGSQAPWISIQPENMTGSVGFPVTFSLSASGGAPLSYQWRKNSVNIAGATSASYTIPSVQAADNGASYSCMVSNSLGSLLSSSAILTVTTNQAPTAVITAPLNNAAYTAGSTINYTGSGSDPEDGALAAGAFSWTIDFRHDTHSHPFQGPINGVTGGSFVIPRTGELATNVWYRIHLKTTDSGGLTATKFVDIFPRLANISLATVPPGLQVSLDGQAYTSPASIQSVAGTTRTISAPATQTLDGTTYQFSSWSDSGAISHDINTPSTNTTYTATYTSSGGQGAIIVDNRDAGAAKTGTWVTGTVAGYHGADYIHDGNTAKGSLSVRFTPNLPSPGNYEVFAWWVSGTNRATNVPIDIVNAQSAGFRMVDQQSNGSSWVSLGQYPFNAGTGGNVLIRNTSTNGYVIADAVKFVPVTGPSIMTFEGETTANTPTDPVTIHTNYPGASGGAWALLNSNLVDDSITYTLPSVPAGTYSVVVRGARYTSRGKFQLSVDGALLGTIQDMYSTTATLLEYNLGSKTFSTAGTHTVKLTVKTPNPSSSGHSLGIDYIRLIPQN